MAWIAPVAGAAIGALGSFAGNSMASSGQQAANAAMIQEQNKIMDWETQMSNTAMTRRVSDLRSAGLNPLLAVGEGGASTPGMSAVGLGNPSAAWGNLGSQLSSAAQVGTNIAATEQQQPLITANASAASAAAMDSQASANLKNVTAAKAAGVDTDVAKQGIQATQQQILESQTRQDLMKAQAEQATAQASLSRADVQVAQARVPEIQAHIALLGQQTTSEGIEQTLKRIGVDMADLNMTQFKYISPYLVQSAAAAASEAGSKAELTSLDIPGAVNRAKMQSGNPGVAYIDAIANWFHVGAQLR